MVTHPDVSFTITVAERDLAARRADRLASHFAELDVCPRRVGRGDAIAACRRAASRIVGVVTCFWHGARVSGRAA